MKAITVDRLIDYLPHRPPMVWIDQILDFSELFGRAEVIFDENKLYCHKKHLKEESYIEFMAQAYGYIEAAKIFSSNKKDYIQKGYLTAIDDFEVKSFLPHQNGETILIEVEILKKINEITIIQSQVKKKNILIAEGKLKIYGLINE